MDEEKTRKAIQAIMYSIEHVQSYTIGDVWADLNRLLHTFSLKEDTSTIAPKKAK